jgi:hypothetical protein
VDTIVTYLKDIITDLQADKEEYYEQNHNRTDAHIMWLVGNINGIDLAIKAIEKETASV